MIMEVFPKKEDQSMKDETPELSLKIIDTNDELYYGEDTPVLEEGVIIHYRTAIPGKPEGINKFRLLKKIGNYHYIFSFAESYTPNTYNINFKTEEYEYARIDLNEDERKELWATISSLVESINSYPGISLEVIMVSPADASYTSEQIESCIDEILESDPEFTREDLLKDYKGFRIFDLYNKKFHKNFLSKHYNKISKAGARSRLFKNSFKKYLPNWDISDNGINDFILRRKM